MRFESSVKAEASPEAIWEAVHDPEEWPLWVPSIKLVEKVSDGPLGVGSRLRIVVKTSIRVTLHMTITEFVPQERVVMQGRVLGTRLTRFYALEPVGQETRVAAGGEASGLLAWLVCWSGRRLSADIVRALKNRIEEVGAV